MKRLAVSAAIILGLMLAGTLVHQVENSARAETGERAGLPWGDVNCSSAANSIDAALVLQYEAGFKVIAACFHLADVNGDGDRNAIDALLILQYNAGVIRELLPPPFDFGPGGTMAHELPRLQGAARSPG